MVRFIEAYKHLEKLCGEVMNDDRRIGAYIDEMRNNPKGAFYVPGWEENFEDPSYQFQTPLTELEIICYDGYAWMIICKPELSARIQERLPLAMPPKEWYPAHTTIRPDEKGNEITVIQ